MDIPGMSKEMFEEAMRTKPLVTEAMRRMRMRVLGASAVMSDACDGCDKGDNCDDGLVLDVATSVTILTACLNETLICADKNERVPDAQLHLFFEILVITSTLSGFGEDDWGDEGTIAQVLQDKDLYPDNGSVDELERVGKHIVAKLFNEIETEEAMDVDRYQLALAAAFMLTSDHLASVRDQGGITDMDRLHVIAKMEVYCAGSLENDREKRKLH